MLDGALSGSCRFDIQGALESARRVLVSNRHINGNEAHVDREVHPTVSVASSSEAHSVHIVYTQRSFSFILRSFVLVIIVVITQLRSPTAYGWPSASRN